MDDTQHDDDFPPLTIGQMHSLAATIRYSFGGKLSRAVFTDHFLMFLEDVPGCESGEVAAALIESAWAEYTSHRDKS